MKKLDYIKKILVILLGSFSMTGCVISPSGNVASTAASSAQPAAIMPTATIAPTATPNALAAISAGNAQEISQLITIPAVFPKYYQNSPDGRIGAQANLSGIDIREMTSGKLVMHIQAELPDCQYGSDRYFVFNLNGGFIALAARDSLQVWQVGAGQIYSAPYSMEYSTDAATCGADIPQLALSPDGTLLAVSGVDYIKTSAEQYFRIINVLENRTVYEWDGSDESLHGKLYPYQGLGFSDDGRFIQTFDPTRYYASSGTEYQSFRFWNTEDWQEAERDSAEIKSSFSPAQLLYALQSDDSVAIKDRLTGQVSASLTGTGCSLGNPCDLRFSVGGKYIAILANDNTRSVVFHHDLLQTQFILWDLGGQRMEKQAAIFARNLDGVQVTDDGAYQDAAAMGEAGDSAGDWWTSSFNFNGLTETAKGRISFTPQRLSLQAGDCYFCGSCTLELDTLKNDCQAATLAQENTSFKFSVDEARITVEPEGEKAFEIAMPAELEEGWDVRLLGYAPENQTVFYCLDKNQRSQTCNIYAAETGREVAQPEDIYGLRFSPDGSSAAYINRNQKALFLVNLQKGKAARVPAYQSRAWFANPVFMATDPEMIFLIQNLNDPNLLSLEWVDIDDGGVQRRAALETGLLGQPSALALNAANNLLAVGNRDGWVYLLDENSGKLITSWQASTENLIGLTFARSDELLVSLDGNGELAFWGVK